MLKVLSEVSFLSYVDYKINLNNKNRQHTATDLHGEFCHSLKYNEIKNLSVFVEKIYPIMLSLSVFNICQLCVYYCGEGRGAEMSKKIIFKNFIRDFLFSPPHKETLQLAICGIYCITSDSL